MAIYGTLGDDVRLGSSSGDWIYGYPDGTADPNTETGHDSLRGADGNDRLFGGGGNDTLRGDDGYDRMTGGDGDDMLQDGGTGLDLFDGGSGNDLFLTSGSGNDTFLGGAGEDTLRLEGDVTWSRLTLNAAASVETLDLREGVLRGTTGNDWIDLSGVRNVALGGRAIEMGAGNNTFIGHAGADRVLTSGGYADFMGGAGNDTLRAVGSLVKFDGGAGDDLLLLSRYGWNDTILGGAGTDTVRLSGAANRHNLILDAASGIEVFDRAGFALTGTTYSDVFDFSGLRQFNDAGPRIDMGNGHDRYAGWSGNDAVLGGHGNDTLIGGAGNDTLDGGTSDDTMIGGIGNDRYFVDRATDLVDEAGANGIDTVVSSVSFSLALSSGVRGALENLTLTGDAAINGSGNNLNNQITGNGVANVLSGGAGSDTLTGGAGNDTLIGGLDNDTLVGGAGNDRLDGGSGIDLMIGGAGNDTYVIDGDTFSIDNSIDRVIERTGEGVDLVLAYTNVTLAANVENLILKGEAIEGRGNALSNTITGNAEHNRLWGGDGNDRIDGRLGRDTISGGNGDDRLFGGDGNDRLSGGAGRDQLAGGAGQDWLTGNPGADSFVFATKLQASNVDHITDFYRGAGDRILLDSDIFSGLGTGRLDQADFRNGTGATGAGAQVIYDRDSGRLWFDADGAGGVDKQLVAILDNHAYLSADAIFLI